LDGPGSKKSSFRRKMFVLNAKVSKDRARTKGGSHLSRPGVQENVDASGKGGKRLNSGPGLAKISLGGSL